MYTVWHVNKHKITFKLVFAYFVHPGDRYLGLGWMNLYLLRHKHLQYELS
jgi:hypothetical protein